jgi:hypothetical protein
VCVRAADDGRVGGSVFRFEWGNSFADVRVVDEDRGAELRTFGSIGRTGIRVGLLTWGDRRIPLEYVSEDWRDAASGRSHSRYGFVRFGLSDWVRERAGVGPYRFVSLEVQEQARLMAIEAILVNHFGRVEHPWNVDSAQFASEGREWRVTDFGHAGWTETPE